MSHEKPKTHILKNFLSIFRNWDFDPPMSGEYSLSGARNWGHATRLTCDQVARIGQHCFEIFDIFAKTKYFPKTTKTLKNLFVFDQQKLSMWKHI